MPTGAEVMGKVSVTFYRYVGDVNLAVDVFGLWENTPAEDLDWTPHGNKHKAPKGKSWKDIVGSTKNGPAKYVPGLDIETFERGAWDQGTPVTNDKTWKVFDAGETIGAKNGKSTTFVRIELSAGTIHGHPIQQSEFKKLTKPKPACPGKQ